MSRVILKIREYQQREYEQRKNIGSQKPVKSSRKILILVPVALDPLIFLDLKSQFAFFSLSVKSPSAKKPRQTRRIQAKLGEKIPGESSAKICEKTQRKLDQSSAKSRRKLFAQRKFSRHSAKRGRSERLLQLGGRKRKSSPRFAPLSLQAKIGGRIYISG